METANCCAPLPPEIENLEKIKRELRDTQMNIARELDTFNLPPIRYIVLKERYENYQRVIDDYIQPKLDYIRSQKEYAYSMSLAGAKDKLENLKNQMQFYSQIVKDLEKKENEESSHLSKK